MSAALFYACVYEKERKEAALFKLSLSEGKGEIQRSNDPRSTFLFVKIRIYIKRAVIDRPFREPMQLGSLRFERPPEVQIYLPSFLVRQKIFVVCGRRPKVSPLESDRLFEKSWIKNF